MTTPRRLRAAAAAFALVGAVTCTTVWGDSANPPRKLNAFAGTIRPAPDLAPSDVGGRFGATPVVTYQTLDGETHFALQLKADLPASQARPRDVAVVIDTSASQSGPPLRNARLVLDELNKAAKPGDRISVWTVNTPDTTKNLTAGFQAPRSAKIAEAIDFLANREYAAGATDLKDGLKKVVRGFGSQSSHQQVILFLGDGESNLNPLNDADRAAIAGDLASREIGFFTVPLGTRLDPANLHGLASATGGAVIRMLGEESAPKFLPKLTAAFDVPVFYPTRSSFSAEVAVALPGRLPPLRGDAPTLVAGLLKPDAKTVAVTAEGLLAGRKHTVTISQAVPAPDPSNYFLVALVHQWRSANTAAPALVRADRSLALAYEQTRLAKDEVLAQAHLALSQNQLDAAGKLFEAARKIDPRDQESQTGLRVVGKLKDGKITREQLRAQLSDPTAVGLRVGKGQAGTVELVRQNLSALEQDPPPASLPPPEGVVPPVAGAVPPVPAGADLLDLERRRRLVQEQQVTQIVDDTIARARQLVESDPDAAYDLLKRQLTSVRENTDLGNTVKATLAARLEGALRSSVAEGTRVRQRQQVEIQRRLADEARKAAELTSANEQELIRERIRAFGALMGQARYEEAYKEALVLQQEQLSKGRPVPVSATAAYSIALNSANLREFDELRRIKEDRYLLTMLQVDRSHVPFPDEPPVAFPPAATWRELTNYRKDKYDAVGLEGTASRNALKIRDRLNSPVTLEKPVENAPLRDVLEYLSDKYELTFIVDTQAFEQAGVGGGRNVEDSQVRLPKMPGVTLGTIMRFLLSQVNGTYLIRRDYIEITTNDRAIAEKAVRAYPVADLVIPIPNSVNQQALNQNLQVLGSSLSANGQAIFGQLGGGGALGFQGALGALGVLGPLGALGAAGGAQGIGGGAIGAGGAGGGQFQGGLGFGGGNGQTNLGFGGGTLGFGGGQQGQFGNLGGQFGLQGGDTSAILIELIQDVIAPKEWQLRAARYLFNNTNTMTDEEQPLLNPDLLNSLGYYQPSRALVVRATSKIHTRIGTGPIGGRPGGMGAAGRPGNDAIVIRPGERREPRPVVANANQPKGTPNVHEQVNDLLGDLRAGKDDKGAAAVAKAPRDANKAWNDAFDKDRFRPRQVIAVADVLAIGDKFDEVTALLQADLRKGVLVQPCVFDALAIALKASGGTPEERERVLLSAIDLDPRDPKAYLQAADAMRKLGKPEKALAFCKRAATLEPNAADPYAKSLVLLASAKDVDTDAVEWAAGNLMRHEWLADRDAHLAQAQHALADAASRLRAAGRSADADRIQAAIVQDKQRDLVIDAVWADQADLDLEVAEPSGTVCSPREPQTTGGGMWRGDRLMSGELAEKYRESYTAAEGFSGSYEVRVRKVWGQPQGDKVTVRVTRHQGAANEAQELHRLTFGSDGVAYLKILLEDGRREHLATVPPPARRPTAAPAVSQDRVYNLLRAMSEPAYSGMTKAAMMGGTSAAGAAAAQVLDGPPDAVAAELVHQNKLNTGDTFRSGGVELVGEATVSADRSKVTVRMAPVFQTASDRPEVKLSMIPGGQ
jgi:tetratricopeptide (TPR) repeat protein